MAHSIFENFVRPCDLGLDFHTSTRGRTNMLHVRANTAASSVERLANAFGTSVVIDSEGPDGTLRAEATAAGVPTVTVEMGEAHRFQRDLIDEALRGVDSVLAEYGMREPPTVRWPGWRTVISGGDEKTWIRADAGGIVDVHHDRGAVVDEGDRICTITSPFKNDSVSLEAPFSGLLVGVLKNPVVSPGNPICHLVGLDDEVRRVVEARRSTGEA
jgi:Predicted deacylase